MRRLGHIIRGHAANSGKATPSAGREDTYAAGDATASKAASRCVKTRRNHTTGALDRVRTPHKTNAQPFRFPILSIFHGPYGDSSPPTPPAPSTPYTIPTVASSGNPRHEPTVVRSRNPSGSRRQIACRHPIHLAVSLWPRRPCPINEGEESQTARQRD